MIKQDFLWILALLLVLFLMLSPFTADTFTELNAEHPYLLGFLKFFILASMGELLAIRLKLGHYQKPPYFLLRMIIWGLVGIMIVFFFGMLPVGISSMMEQGMLPGKPGGFLQAFFISSIMNLSFGIAFMATHRISDAYLDQLSQGTKSIHQAIGAVDWNHFFSFVVLKTIPLFWIPAHTITFLIPPLYRVIVAAMLSIALGLILAFAKNKKGNDHATH